MGIEQNPIIIASLLLALVVAIPIHEFAHALSAVNNGDDGPRRAGRLSIMPWDHFDPFGAIFCVVSSLTGIGIGWGKPVLVNPNVLHNPKWDMCKIAAWGPLSNLILAVIFAMPIRFGLVEGTAHLMLLVFVGVNLSLMLFNLIPIGPLDGAKVLVAFLPDRQAYEFTRIMEQYGMFMLLGLITIGRPLVALWITVPMERLMALLLGA
jgi:Zn-dependent protease